MQPSSIEESISGFLEKATQIEDGAPNHVVMPPELSASSKENIMKKALKWIGIVIGVLVVLTIAFLGVAYFTEASEARAVKATALDPALIPPGTETTVAFVNVNLAFCQFCRRQNHDRT
jgi:hypothetical protein